MISFTKLVFAITIALQPLYAIGISEQPGLSRDQFEGLIEKIPDNDLRKQVTGLYEEKKYYDLEVSLVQYLEEYIESSFKGEEREVVESKKEKIIDGVVDFIENAAEAEGLGNGAMDLQSHSFQVDDEDEDKTMSQINKEKAIAMFDDMITNYVIPSKKEEAESLLDDQDFDMLEIVIVKNVDQANRTAVIQKMHAARDFLWHSFSEVEEDSSSVDSELMTTNSLEQESSLPEDAEVMMEHEPTPADVRRAITTLNELINDHIAEDKKEGAIELLTAKNYDDLEYYIYDNIDMDEVFGDDPDSDEGYKVFDNLEKSMETLHNSDGVEPAPAGPLTNSTMFQDNDSLKSSMISDEFSTKEEMLSAMESSLAETEEEIEELIARLNKNREN